MNTTEQKIVAENFLTMITNGHIDEAYKKYVDMNGKHHNVFTPAGFPSLKTGMEENDDQFPDKKLTVLHAVADGDMVMVHSHLLVKPGDPGMVVVHIFRFAGDKIVELWDCGQAIPKDAINSDAAFQPFPS